MSTSPVYRQRWLDKKVREYVRVHGSMPTCECGCGLTVSMNSRGKPNRFAARNHQTRVHDMAELSRKGKEAAARQNGDIPVEKFREVVLRLKRQRDLTWAELAELAGVSVKTLRSAMSVPDKKYVTREWATSFFQRASGMAAKPTEGYRRHAEEVEERIVRAERDIDNSYAVSPDHTRREALRLATKENRSKLAAQRIAEYWETHDEMPLCECGCGERVGFSQSGWPNRFVEGWHTANKRHGVYA